MPSNCQNIETWWRACVAVSSPLSSSPRGCYLSWQNYYNLADNICFIMTAVPQSWTGDHLISSLELPYFFDQSRVNAREKNSWLFENTQWTIMTSLVGALCRVFIKICIHEACFRYQRLYDLDNTEEKWIFVLKASACRRCSFPFLRTKFHFLHKEEAEPVVSTIML